MLDKLDTIFVLYLKLPYHRNHGTLIFLDLLAKNLLLALHLHFQLVYLLLKINSLSLLVLELFQNDLIQEKTVLVL